MERGVITYSDPHVELNECGVVTVHYVAYAGPVRLDVRSQHVTETVDSSAT